MDNPEAPFKALKALHERQYQLKEQEYARLTLATSVIVALTIAVQVAARVLFPQSGWYALSLYLTLLTIFTAVVIGFLVRAAHDDLGVRGYLRIEKVLLINEMPNIFQILSLFGFLNVLLKQEAVKIAVSVLITFLLSIYLTSRRRDMLVKRPYIADKVSGKVTALLSILLVLFIGAATYGVASLISVQIS